MTWFETHERTRIIREIEAHAALDQSGQLPWSDSWAPFFTDRAGLLGFLYARWDRMCVAQLGDLDSPEAVRTAAAQMRRSNAGVLRILEANGLVGLAADRTRVARPVPAV